MQYDKPNLFCDFLITIGLFSIIIITSLLFAPLAAAKEQLDIRPYEAADPCNPDIAQVRVTVNGVGFGGILSVELYHDPENFLNKKGRTKRIRVPATEGQNKYVSILKSKVLTQSPVTTTSTAIEN